MGIVADQMRVNYFLFVYFYELERLLNSDYNSLIEIKFQSEEANTDEFTKKFLQNYIRQNNNIKKSKVDFIKTITNDLSETIEVAILHDFSITNVYIPDELSNEHKADIYKRKSAVYTNPDLLLEITFNGAVFYEPIEIKSTKGNSIPGSSIQQVLPYEWVIFIKRSKEKIEVSTGHYINSLTEKLPFPDRSPRPQVAFETLVDWNKNNRFVENNSLILHKNEVLDQQKIQLLTDWQDYLANEWLEIIKNKHKAKSEKWFNNALRKFAVKFLEYSKELKEEELNDLISSLKRLTD